MDYRIEQLRFQVREDPSSRHFYQLGELLRREGELEDAVEVLRTGLEHHPGYVAAWVSLGRSLFQWGRYEGCRAAFSRALELDRENAVAATMLGRAAGKCGDWEEAARALSLASSLVPTDGELAEEAEDARRRANRLDGSGEAGGGELHMGDSMGEGAAPSEPGAGEPAGGEGSNDGDEPSDEPAEGDASGEDGGSAVFFESAAPEALAAEVPEPFRPAGERLRELVLMSEEDPWAPVFRGDTGVYETGEDVFVPAGFGEPAGEGAPEPFPAEEALAQERIPAEAPEAAPTAVVEAEGGTFAGVEAAAVPEETVAKPAAMQEKLPGGAGAAVQEAGRGPEGAEPPGVMAEPPAMVVETESVDEVTHPAPELEETGTEGEIPLPTATLARLALEQDDLLLAERTAQAVLTRDPASSDARRVLEAIAERRREMERNPAAIALRKIRRLEEWLGRIRRDLVAGGV